METFKSAARISYRYRPSGEHKYRLLALRPVAKPRERNLVYSNEVQDGTLQASRRSLRSGFGATPQKTCFTKLAKERVRDAVAILDQAFGKQCLFTTGTLPGSTTASFEALAQWSGYLVERLKQWLRDNFQGVRNVYVWELQARGALHLHCCFGSDNRRDLVLLRRRWKRVWIELLNTVCDKSGVDLFARADGGTWRYLDKYVRCDAQKVKKSVGRYLSKYLSKTAGQANKEGVFCPSRWWGIDNWLRAQVVAKTICKLSKVLPYSLAKQMFETLTVELSLVGEKYFGWKNRYNPFERSFVCFMSSA